MSADIQLYVVGVVTGMLLGLCILCIFINRRRA